MTKLKTLKDLQDTLAGIIIKQERFIPEEDFVYVKDLREEAIKWVKFCGCKYELCYRCRGFRDFHNITEDDLK